MKKVVAAALTIVAMLALATAAGAGPNSESASGNYTLFGGQYEISFSARATLQHTNASGHIRWIQRNSDPDTIMDAEVTCLFVGPARTATLGGVVTSYTGPFSSPTIRGVFITVKDNGQGPTAFASDTSSQPLTTATPPEQDCVPPFAFGQMPITSGDITVKPALP